MHLTDLQFLDLYREWPPPCQTERINRYKKNEQLWDGKHDEVWGEWWRTLREDKEASLQMVFNWHKRFSTLWADLLVGTPPRIMASDKLGNPNTDQQEHVDRITGKDSNGYQTVLHETAIDISRFGDALQKVTLEEGVAHIQSQPPSYWFPVVHPTNIKRYQAHVLAWQVDIKKPVDYGYISSGRASGNRSDEYDHYLWIEIHTKGQIEYRAHMLDGGYIGMPVPLSKVNPDLADTDTHWLTGVDDEFLLVPFQGLVTSDSIHGKDDYGDLDSLVMGIEIRSAMINWILDKHSDPSLAGPEDLLERDKTGKFVFKAGGAYWPYDAAQGEKAPEYIVWDGKLESAFMELDYLLDELYIISETTPAAFAMQKEGLAESGSALRRLMMTPLKKVERIRMRFDPAAKRAIQIASKLENANGGKSPVLEHIQIQWQDGLPPDPKEQAETEQIRTGNKPTTSQVSAARRIDGGTQEEAEAEIQRITEETEAERQATLEDAEATAAITAKYAPEKPSGGPPSSAGTK